jgi:hypothetical protein
MAKVWIKVCNIQSEGQVRASDTTDLEGGHSSAQRIRRVAVLFRMERWGTISIRFAKVRISCSQSTFPT